MSDIILVGNGSTVIHKKLGDKIDSFDTVVRFNNFEIHSYERFIGTKTDIWVTAIVPEIKDRTNNNFKRIIAIIPWCRPHPQRKEWIKSFQNKYVNAEFISQDFSKSCSDIFKFDRNKNWCTSGMIGILYFLQFYDTIHIYGFGDLSKQHYFRVARHLEVSANQYHRYDIEKEHIQLLEQEGKIINLLKEN